MAKTETIDTYSFDDDAMGLGDFITQHFDANQDSVVVYVSDDEGNPAKQARFERETLSDGSTVVNLVISFDRLA